MKIAKFLWTVILKNTCKRLRLHLTDFSEQLVFREAIFQNNLSNIFISSLLHRVPCMSCACKRNLRAYVPKVCQNFIFTCQRANKRQFINLTCHRVKDVPIFKLTCQRAKKRATLWNIFQNKIFFNF